MQFHDEYGYKPNKNVSSIVNLKYIGRTYNIITDFDGSRIKEDSIKNSNQLNEVLIIGDSLSFGYGLNYRDTYAHWLETNLKKIKNMAARLWNCSIL